MSNADFAYNYLQAGGLSAIGAAGVVGNLMQESGLNPNAIGDGGAAYGIAQWHTGFSNSLATPGKGSTLTDQLDYILNTLKTGQYKNVLKGLNSASSPADAAQVFMQGYERPAAWAANLGNRIAQATKIFGGGSIPDVTGAGNQAGTTGEKPGMFDWVGQIREWLASSHFWQRVVFGGLGLLLIMAAFMLLSRGQAQSIIKGAI